MTRPTQERVRCEACGSRFYAGNVAFYRQDDGTDVCTFCFTGPTFEGEHARSLWALEGRDQ